MGTCAELNFFEGQLQPHSEPLGVILDLLGAPQPAQLPGVKAIPGTTQYLLPQHAMNKQRPSTAAILGMTGFTASCVGLLIFLWISFGGSLPFAPQGYRFSVEFDQAVELASQAQVEISGVTVGHVVGVSLDHRTGLSRAVIEINRQFAPRPADTRATLRQKTLLGETFVELSPGFAVGAEAA